MGTSLSIKSLKEQSFDRMPYDNNTGLQGKSSPLTLSNHAIESSRVIIA